jgi:hypothetical protein
MTKLVSLMLFIVFVASFATPHENPCLIKSINSHCVVFAQDVPEVLFIKQSTGGVTHSLMSDLLVDSR